ncbi:carbohydrate esterase family 8 protein [Gelatoporia subvermispora B]|uniref:pectinesterase n=1 Tax=Ceriporiopsis subvermispora (strain B) TaxID=914234 RepID=M2RLE9_CERS8|nr:carbohydrate esterase family 8 protein [Gelatoporia subvermispora B]
MLAYSLVVLSAVAAPFVGAISPAFIQCQLQKPTSESPLLGCPSGTVFVSQTDPRANFSSVQQAITSLPESGTATILIGQGVYHETVNITRVEPMVLLGQLDPKTAFDPAGNASTRNLVQIWDNKFVENGLSDEETAVFTVSRGTGAKFGSVDFKAYNIDFQNRAANYSISQALVTDISYANASFYGCTFAGYQDTWYTGHSGNTYVIDSIIFGQTDYLFGFGTAWFQNVILANRACGGGLVAWQSTTGTLNGAYIADSKVIRSPDANVTTVTTGECFLGRPWNALAATVYLRTSMDESINAAGFKAWGDGRNTIENTTFYAEFDSSGPGGNTSMRVAQDHILTSQEARPYTIEGVFLGTPAWIDFDYEL